MREASVTRDGERGRPGTGIVLNPARGALAAEINVDYLAVGVLDFTEELLFHETLERHNLGNNPAEILPLLIAMAKRGTTKAVGAGVELLGGELMVPGLVDMERNPGTGGPEPGLVIARLFAGPQGHAGEIGQVVVNLDGPLCACGGHGRVEPFAGQDAIYSAAGIEQDSSAQQIAHLLSRAGDWR